jgi:hypothetical protein
MKEAHKLTKEIKKEYPNVDYKAQLGICIAYLSENKGEVEMVELKGTEKQIAWAEDIRKKELELLHKYQTVTTGNREIATAWTGKENKVIETEIQEVYSEEKFQEAKERLNTLVSLLENESDAKFIIESREDLRRAIANKNNVKCAINKFRKFFESDVVRINF